MEQNQTQTEEAAAVRSKDLLDGLSLLTVIQIRNRADELIRACRWKDTGWQAALLIPPYGRILVSTEPIFESEEAGVKYIDSLVKTCVLYMASREPSNS